ncbi:TrbC family F-type conjugative pilus assembly protein [Stenotrophomonas pavanii]|uniref:TrbC family F-type conjugative pilus assembly protein n=1 Tax=Stenotrophomonas pavanii TaxID=487698 RepID=UPI002DBB4A8B|nr:TrbC family F-type conjugative pilus assembly protein [Stenotrophomonas pavanii]MEC4339690.1 TrbC family F-type conjugative pilus assembly protein [Stenotrophomonas pavanii]
MVIRSTILAIGLAASGMVSAQSAADIANDMERIRENARSIVGEDTLTAAERNSKAAGEAHREEFGAIQTGAQDLFQQGVDLAKEMASSQYNAVADQGRDLPSEASADKNGDVPLRYMIFISQSMPDSEVKALAQTYAGRKDVALVIRGLLPNQNISKVQSWIFKMLSPIDVGTLIPNINMDSQPFTELGVSHVPVIARYDNEGKVQAYALGMTSIGWIDEQVQKGATGNLGSVGPTVQVGEEDIIEVMQKRAAEYDWKGAAEGALGRFWARTEKHELPRTQVRRTLTMDPTIEVQKTISAPDGTVIAAAGDRINPLEFAPFQSVLAFFDPGDHEQVQWAKAVVESSDAPVILMASQLRSLEGLEGLGRMSDDIGARIFKLPNDVRERFNLQVVPTIVRAHGPNFIIDEQLPSDRPKD